MFDKGKDTELSKILRHVSELEGKGKIKQAIKELQTAIKLNPKEGNLYNRLGDLYIKDEQVQESIAAYKKGVEAYRRDGYSRNALALCKKIMRIEPANLEIPLIIAEVLVELDEKSDALIYFFAYVEKQLAQNNTDEVLKGIDKIRELEILDGKTIKKINETYMALDREDLAKKFAEEILKEDVIEDISILEPIPAAQKKVEKKIAKKEIKPKEKVMEVAKEEKKIEVEITHLDDAVKDVEAAIVQLRKAIRLDEVIIALDKSLTALSGEQKKAIALLQKSMSHNLDALQNSVRKLDESSDKNIKDLENLLGNLSKALADLSKNQASFTDKINENLEKVGDSFNSTANDAVNEIRSVMSDYQKATDDMCSKLEETKNCNVTLVKVIDEMKVTVLKMNESLIKFVMAQEYKEKKQGQYALIIIVIIAAICGLFIFSLFK
jgi:tetratricopeptide (TPR) repeat protein